MPRRELEYKEVVEIDGKKYKAVPAKVFCLECALRLLNFQGKCPVDNGNTDFTCRRPLRNNVILKEVKKNDRTKN